MEFVKNPEQEAVINAPITNILVSAGAGSGKTSVLTRRIIDQIINKHYNLDDFLIVTFTNAAGAEMRSRIKGALIKNNLTELASKVDSANIKTFDSFRLFLLKKYGYLIGINSEISNIDADIISVKVYEEINRQLDKAANMYPIEMQDLYANYEVKTDDGLVDFIYDIYYSLAFKEDYESILDNYSDIFFKDIEVKLKTKLFELAQETTKNILHYAGLVSDEFYDKVNEVFQEFLDAKDFGEIRLAKKHGKIQWAKSGATIIQPYCAKSIKKLKDLTNFDCDYYLNNDVRLHKEFMPIITCIAKNVITNIRKYKLDRGVFEFADIEMLTNGLLKKHPEVSKKLKEQFKIIMIDEFQDTSIVQDQFINYFSNNNVFMVGDIKQSIYKFRRAEPALFANYAENLKNEKMPGLFCPMNTSFRSRPEVVNDINNIFGGLMRDGLGGTNYIEDGLLQAGNINYLKEKDAKAKYGIIPLATKFSDRVSGIIHDIKGKMASNFQVYDKESNKMRPAKYSDFAILIDRSTKFQDIGKEFTDNGIPLTILKDENISDENYVKVIKSIFRFINTYNCPKNKDTDITLKHAYVSVVRSFLFSYDDEKIYTLISSKEYYKEEVYIKLINYAKLSYYMTLSELFMFIINDLNFVEKLSSIGNAITYLGKINFINNKIIKMDELGYSITDFISYLDSIKKYDLKMEAKTMMESDNSVTLETIHKSKGLEYSIVYFPFFNQDLYKKPTMKSYFIDENSGFWLKTLCKQLNPFKLFHEKELHESDVNEKIRLLYVALTRCREIGYIMFDIEDSLYYPEIYEELNGEINNDIKTSNLSNKINDNYAEDEEDDDYENDDDEPQKISAESLFERIKRSKSFQDMVFEVGFSVAPEGTDDQIAGIRLSSQVELPSLPGKFKLLKNEIPHEVLIKQHASKISSDTNNIFILKKGTHYHLLMEEVDLVSKDVSFIKNATERNDIKNVLGNEIFSQITKRTGIYKEYSYFDEANNVSGSIDLMLIYDGHIDIVDYKLKHIDDLAYKHQLETYKEYVSRIFNKPTNCYLLSLMDNKLEKIF